MLYSLLSHALACRKGTARIQLRCRAVAATVLLVMLVVRSVFVVCCALGPKVVSKMQAPNLPQDLQKGTKNAVGISKKGSKMTKMGPETGTRRPRKGQNGPHGTRRRILVRKRRSPPRKSSPFWSKIVPKIDGKNAIKNSVVFEIVSEADIFDFGSKMVPKWSRRGAKIDTKTASGHKSGFSLPSTKIKGFRRKSGVRDLHFEAHSAPEFMKKRRLMSISVFYQLFIDFGSVSGAQNRPRRLIFETLFRHRKKSAKKVSTGSHE